MRLWSKILLSTAIVVLLCLVVAGVLAGVLIRRGFDRYVVAQEQNYVQRLGPVLADYYERTGSWAGLDTFLTGRRGQTMGQGMMGMGAGMRLIVLDADRRVVLDTQGLLVVGQGAPADVWEAGAPIVVRGREVGRLTSGAALTEERNRSAVERTFLGSLGWVLVLAGLVGFAAAAIAATLLALQITAPARDLTRAARRIAAGDRTQRVDVRSGDELGQVGTAFNDMATALAQQEELRRHLVADVAHELRTPLSVIQVELESLQDGLTEPSPEALASLREEVGLLSRLVEDLRLLSLLDAGQLPLQTQPVPLVESVQRAVQQTAREAERKGVTLQTALPEDLPAARADPDRLQQVLLNLLHNALRHTPAGGAVRLLAQVEGSSLHLQVVDTGEGIAPQDLPRIFDRFYRGDASRARTSGGSGLGLTIARGLVEAMGGRIWAESTLGRGATIHFTVPVVGR